MLEELINEVSNKSINDFFRRKIRAYKIEEEELGHLLNEKDFKEFSGLTKLGEVEYSDSDELLVFSCKYNTELSSRSSKKKQYEIAKKVLKEEYKDAAIFIFYDESRKFRFSLIRTNYLGGKKTYTTWKRYTYFIDPAKPNKTFRQQLNNKDKEFESLDELIKAFSIDAVTDDFYNDFMPRFTELAQSVKGTSDFKIQQDFALLFVIRIIFIGFVQKRGWLGGSKEYMMDVWNAYKENNFGEDQFYPNWLEPLFFDALNSPPGREVKYRNNNYPESVRLALKMAPYLNGELFKRKPDLDNRSYFITDSEIKKFFEFLFSYNFTIEENTNYDEELELNPEFLGIIFERLVNKEDGAVYTPRTEVDFMCRISLVKWLQKVSDVDTRDLYHLFFIQEGEIEDQKQGDFSAKEIEQLVELLKSVSICDPASGSGAFPVGMMQVLNEILENLLTRKNTPGHLVNEDSFERKKAIIANSLYGVEVKKWAVWINQLRLWLSLFVDVPVDREDEFRYSPQPLLPNLDFKIRTGDSIVQRIGDKIFPVNGHAAIHSGAIKRRITELKKEKIDFFFNRSGTYRGIRKKENNIFRAIIDEQIADLKKEIKRYKTPKGEQTIMFDIPNPKENNLFEGQIRTLEEQINELEQERIAFKDEHPLIWNIEFAEIFFDKGGFDIIIGNPPYIRQEDIADPYQKVAKATQYKELLKESIRLEFPKHFVKKEKIDGKSDLYTYFYIKSLGLLNEKGIHTFICSNSWLDVGYGIWQQKFLLNYCNHAWIIDNHAKRSFATADVNTIISILDAPVKSKKNLDPNSLYKFIAFKKPFEEVVLSDYLLRIENQNNGTERNRIYRSMPLNITKLKEEGSEFESEADKKLNSGKYIGDKWGSKFLRAPDLYFKLRSNSLLNKFGSFCKIETVSWSRLGRNDELIRPVLEPHRSGLNSIPVLKSPKDFKTPYFDSVDLKYQLVFEDEVTEKIRYSDIFWDDLRDKRHRCLFTDKPVAYSHAFHGIIPLSKKDRLKIVLILNSTINHLLTEIYSRTGLGGGAARVLVNELRSNFMTIHPSKIKLQDSLIEEVLNTFKTREVNAIFEEVGINPNMDIPILRQEPNPLPDRKKLDDIVFDAMGLTEEERKEVYREVCQMVWNRMKKAQSV